MERPQKHRSDDVTIPSQSDSSRSEKDARSRTVCQTITGVRGAVVQQKRRVRCGVVGQITEIAAMQLFFFLLQGILISFPSGTMPPSDN